MTSLCTKSAAEIGLVNLIQSYECASSGAEMDDICSKIALLP